MTRARTLVALAATGLVTVAQAARAQTVAITGARVFPVSGPPIDNATVLIRGGRIAAVGANVAIPADARRVDAAGRWVTPGLVDAMTALGAYEIGAVNNTVDIRPRGRESIAASFRVWLGLNPSSVLLTPARNDGVTSVGVAPSGGLIAGQAAIIDLVSSTSTLDMVRRAPVAMVAQVGPPQGAGIATRGELIDRLREVLADARTFSRRRAEFERRQTREFAASRLDLEALLPVVEGRLPLIVETDKAADIEGALGIAQEFGLRLIVAGGAEAWMLANRLAAARVPVLTNATNNIPSSFATLGSRQENAALLRRAGVTVALIGGPTEAFNVRNIRQEAGNAVAYGMPWEEALRAVTLVPATLLGVADRIGSLEVGKDANVVVWSGDPFEFTTVAERVFIRGREIAEPSRQDMLMERYRSLPPKYSRP
ncbi:MAG: amidohydrolase family protein [Gemmatimonadota bacterium]|nr:amidohydrolase family protein [Gemmatimonadota bacterium]